MTARAVPRNAAALASNSWSRQREGQVIRRQIMELDDNHVTVSATMRVFDARGRLVGTVRDVNENSMTVWPLYGTRPLKISLASVASGIGNEVHLGATGGAIRDMVG